MKIKRCIILGIVFGIICVNSTTLYSLNEENKIEEPTIKTIENKKSFDTNIKQVEQKIKGINLQIEKANHYIDYAKLKGMSEEDPSIRRAKEIISESRVLLENLDSESLEALKKDEEEKKKWEENNKNNIVIEITENQKKYKKLQSILEILNLEKIEEIPIEFLKSMGLYNYTYDLLKKENVELPPQWVIEEKEKQNEENEENKENTDIIDGENKNEENNDNIENDGFIIISPSEENDVFGKG